MLRQRLERGGAIAGPSAGSLEHRPRSPSRPCTHFWNEIVVRCELQADTVADGKSTECPAIAQRTSHIILVSAAGLRQLPARLLS